MFWYIVTAVVTLYLILRFTGFFCGGQCKSKRRLVNKVVVITGANSGIGLETAIELAHRGPARLILGCRDMKKAEKCLPRIKSAAPPGETTVDLFCLDLADLNSIKEFANKVKQVSNDKVDLLVNNAGLITGTAKATKDFEMHMVVNYLGHYYLTELLSSCLHNANGSPRVVNVSSRGYQFTRPVGLDIDNPKFGSPAWSDDFQRFHDYQLYGQSKLAQIYHARELTRRSNGRIVAFSLHPGSISTDISRTQQGFMGNVLAKLILALVGKTLNQGAQTTLHCCLDDQALLKYPGEYFADCQVQPLESWAIDDQKQRKLWTWSRQKLGLD